MKKTRVRVIMLAGPPQSGKANCKVITIINKFHKKDQMASSIWIQLDVTY
jgi:uncharacterized protein YggU (UPF0235/DUF167 family)